MMYSTKNIDHKFCEYGAMPVHQTGNSLNWQFIQLAIHQTGNSSNTHRGVNSANLHV